MGLPSSPGTNISPKHGILKMIFLFPRWDMLIPWRVTTNPNWWAGPGFLKHQQFAPENLMVGRLPFHYNAILWGVMLILGRVSWLAVGEGSFWWRIKHWASVAGNFEEFPEDNRALFGGNVVGPPWFGVGKVSSKKNIYVEAVDLSNLLKPIRVSTHPRCRYCARGWPHWGKHKRWPHPKCLYNQYIRRGNEWSDLFAKS